MFVKKEEERRSMFVKRDAMFVRRDGCEEKQVGVTSKGNSVF